MGVGTATFPERYIDPRLAQAFGEDMDRVGMGAGEVESGCVVVSDQVHVASQSGGQSSQVVG